MKESDNFILNFLVSEGKTGHHELYTLDSMNVFKMFREKDMHYSWHKTLKEIMTRKCWVLKNTILGTVTNNKMRRNVERKLKNVATDTLIRKNTIEKYLFLSYSSSW